MHGLVNKAIECFVRDTHGASVWSHVVKSSGLETDRFEPMLMYEDSATQTCLAGVSAILASPVEAVLEDTGTYLVSHAATEPVRRLLRFGGVNFTDFLLSLDDLPDRARLAMPDLVLPEIAVEELNEHSFNLAVGRAWPQFSYVLMGVLRALADDCGALVMLEHTGEEDSTAHIDVEIYEAAFAAGRRFDLADRRARR